MSYEGNASFVGGLSKKVAAEEEDNLYLSTENRGWCKKLIFSLSNLLLPFSQSLADNRRKEDHNALSTGCYSCPSSVRLIKKGDLAEICTCR